MQQETVTWRQRSYVLAIYGFMLLIIRCHSLNFELKDLCAAEILTTLMGVTYDFRGLILKLLDIKFQISTPKSKSELLVGLGRKKPNLKFCYKLNEIKQT